MNLKHGCKICYASKNVVVFNFENNMSICTIHILIARTICYTRLLSPLLLLRPLLQFTHCSLASQKYQILECLYFSLQTILLNFQKTRRDKSLMWPKGCSSVKVWWSGTLKGGAMEPFQLQKQSLTAMLKSWYTQLAKPSLFEFNLSLNVDSNINSLRGSPRRRGTFLWKQVPIDCWNNLG